MLCLSGATWFFSELIVKGAEILEGTETSLVPTKQ